MGGPRQGAAIDDSWTRRGAAGRALFDADTRKALNRMLSSLSRRVAREEYSVSCITGHAARRCGQERTWSQFHLRITKKWPIPAARKDSVPELQAPKTQAATRALITCTGIALD
jgi:hypothetical protein